MINGFEEITYNLNEFEEKKIVPAIVHIITEIPRGKMFSITNQKIRDILSDKFPRKISGVRFRKCINFIRKKGLIPLLLASNKGYWKSNDIDLLFLPVAGNINIFHIFSV